MDRVDFEWPRKRLINDIFNTELMKTLDKTSDTRAAYIDRFRYRSELCKYIMGGYSALVFFMYPNIAEEWTAFGLLVGGFVGVMFSFLCFQGYKLLLANEQASIIKIGDTEQFQTKYGQIQNPDNKGNGSVYRFVTYGLFVYSVAVLMAIAIFPKSKNDPKIIRVPGEGNVYINQYADSTRRVDTVFVTRGGPCCTKKCHKAIENGTCLCR